MYSSQNEQDTRMVARAAMVPVVLPDSEEARAFTKIAYELENMTLCNSSLFNNKTSLTFTVKFVNLEERQK